MGDRLSEVAAAARKAGMSYGQYVAMQRETENMPHPRLLDPRRRALAVVEADAPEVPVCAVCGREFAQKRKTKVCCSPGCQKVRSQQRNSGHNRDRYRIMHQVQRYRVCPECGKEFPLTHGKQLCCSEECAYGRHLKRVTQRNRERAAKRQAIGNG